MTDQPSIADKYQPIDLGFRLTIKLLSRTCGELYEYIHTNASIFAYIILWEIFQSVSELQ